MHYGKELILLTKPFAREIRWKSWYYTLSTLILLIFGIALTTHSEYNPVLRLIISLLTGFMIVRFFVIYHDNQHHAILHQSIPARIIFGLFGIYVLAPTSIWKRSHDYHHNHNSKLFSASIGSYPIMTVQKFRQSSKAEQRLYLAIRHPLTIFFGYISMFLLGMCLRSFLSAPKRHWDSLLAIILHVAVTVWMIITFGWIMWLFVIIIPFMTACGIGAYLFYAQHNFPGVKFDDKEDWKYEVAALHSSSYMEMNSFWKWVTANIGYHHIHHLNSRIPFYRLPEAMAALPELQNPVITTLNPSDIWACFRLKVWDPEKKAMVGLND
ncbi:MAG: fatty acid desaturase [Bacteroidia bacterium]|jgi:omega-6 fatty acid desaturase (delta-12 desaturase)